MVRGGGVTGTPGKDHPIHQTWENSFDNPDGGQTMDMLPTEKGSISMAEVPLVIRESSKALEGRLEGVGTEPSLLQQDFHKVAECTKEVRNRVFLTEGDLYLLK
ncbi:hypothetical protein NDU88_004446 [Pleurodeles waltl]|uniref:Synaptosomal-associated protein n=1 Tax=Pleurodeles waltl TaxID=8319 RepID=A0AAV7NJF4_PLEWA|nr:hypothetical protein NDU88_004446 [Pleurodeles waltl]